MRLFVTASMIIALGLGSVAFANQAITNSQKNIQIAASNIVDDGGSLKFSAPPSRSTSQSPSTPQQEIKPNYGPTEFTRKENLTPNDLSVLGSVSDEDLMRNYNAVKDKMPKNMQNLPPDKLREAYEEYMREGKYSGSENNEDSKDDDQ